MTAPRVAVVTGAASGIGKATVHLLIQQGWRVAALDRDESSIRTAVSSLGHALVPLAADVTKPDALRRELQGFVRKINVAHLDLLVNCAGLLHTGNFEEQTSESIALLLLVNNTGVAHCCQAAFPLLLQSAGMGRKPAVVNLSSASAAAGIPSMAIYSASKFWVRGFTEALSCEWARHRIAVRSVMPPFVRTPMLHANTENRFVKALGVKLTPEDVAQQIVKAAGGGPLHRLVSMQFKTACLLTQMLPGWVTRAVLKRIAYPN
jgi:NAD(P)-dependent dehydrogenase (short-subunit alcohol dehydrogenase family)